jgi:hypothetical protein
MRRRIPGINLRAIPQSYNVVPSAVVLVSPCAILPFIKISSSYSKAQRSLVDGKLQVQVIMRMSSHWGNA